MKRRAFITLLGSAAVAWPLAARAQQAERMRRIGVLTPFAADDPEGQARLRAFMQGLQQLGWTDGRNLRIDIRWGAGDAERIRRNAAELVALAPDVILAVASATTGPLLRATRAVPIVFVQLAEPVGAGFVDEWLPSKSWYKRPGPASSARSRPRPHRSCPSLCHAFFGLSDTSACGAARISALGLPARTSRNEFPPTRRPSPRRAGRAGTSAEDEPGGSAAPSGFACRFKEKPRSARGSCHTLTTCTAPDIRSHAGSRCGSRTYCRVSSGRERRTIHSAGQSLRHMIQE